MPGRLVWAWYILAVPPSSRGAHFFAAENLVCLILRWTWRLGFEKRLALIHFIFHHSLFVPRLIFSLLFMYGSATACILSLRTSILDCDGCRSPLPPLLPPPHTHTQTIPQLTTKKCIKAAGVFSHLYCDVGRSGHLFLIPIRFQFVIGWWPWYSYWLLMRTYQRS